MANNTDTNTTEKAPSWEDVTVDPIRLGTVHGRNAAVEGVFTSNTKERKDFPSISFPPYVDFSLQKDYLNIRNRFLKGYTSISGEPGYFYFKVLFDFVGSPLLRNNIAEIISETDPVTDKTKFEILVKDASYDFITAEKFLVYNSRRSNCAKRYAALRRFLDLLYYVSHETPWAIRSVQGLGEALAVDFNQLASQDKKITLLFGEETTDFRLTLLNDLYRFICYDTFNQRIIVPENLRKFNMSIIFFSVPIRWFQTPIKSGYLGDTINNAVQLTRNLFGGDSSINKNELLKDKNNPGYKGIDHRTVFNKNKYINYRVETDWSDSLQKSVNYEDWDDSSSIDNNPNESLSVHMLHFRNCEISLKSTYSSFAQGDNQRPFQTTPKWEIEFQRCYQQDVSEWFDLNVSEFFLNFDLGSSYSQTIELQINEAAEQALKGLQTDSLIQQIIKTFRKDKDNGKDTRTAVTEAVQGAWDRIKDTVKNTASEIFTKRTGGDVHTRLKYIKERYLWGGASEFSAYGISQALDKAIDNVISPLNDFITLGNIYDDSWANYVSNLLNTSSSGDVLKQSLSFIGTKTGTPWLKNIGQGGISSVTDQLSSAAGLYLTGRSAQANNSMKSYWGQTSPSDYRLIPAWKRFLTYDKDNRTNSPTIYNSSYYPDGNLYDLKYSYDPDKSIVDQIKEYAPKGTAFNNLKTEDKTSEEIAGSYVDRRRRGTIYSLYNDNYYLQSYYGSAQNIYNLKNTGGTYNKLTYYSEQEPLFALNGTSKTKSLTFSMLYEYNVTGASKKPLIGEQLRTSTPLTSVLSKTTSNKARVGTLESLYSKNFLIPKENKATQPLKSRTSTIDNLYVNNTILAAQNFEANLPYKNHNK